MKKTAAVIIFMLLFVSAAFAEEEALPKMPNILGAGVLVSPSPYKDVDTYVYGVPIVYAEKDNFFIRINQAGYSFYKKEPFEAYAFLQPRLMGYRSDRSDFFAGMNRRNWSVDAGLGAQMEVPYLKGSMVEVNLMQDVLANSKGQEVDVFYWYMFDLRPLFLIPKAGLMWESNKVIDYYYGVNDAEAAANRPAYSPGSCINYRLGLDSMLFVSQQWALVGRVYVDFFGSEIKDSPLIDKDYSPTFLAGVVYKF
jgi:outer membrane protein